MPVAVKITAAANSAANDELSNRILGQARADFLTHGYSAVTMDAIATELGISKKTLYQHFSSKDALIRDVILGLSREIRAEADALLRHRRLNFAEKLRGFAEGLAQRMLTSAKSGLLVKLDERSCLGGSVTKKYKSSNYGNVTAEVMPRATSVAAHV
jgi:AcrR family transcriptional regulator